MKKHLSYILSLIVLCAFCLSACSPASNTAKTETKETAYYPITVTDQMGREVTIDKEPQKLVSGYYISTSILISLGLKDRLVGIEAKADKRPIYKLAAPELINLPNVGTAKQFDLEGCVALEPDLVVLPLKLKDTAATLEEMGIKVILVDPENESKLLEAITLVGKATNKNDKADEIKATINAVIDDLTKKTENIERPNVCITGTSSVLTVAPGKMYQSALAELGGASNVAVDVDSKSWAEVSYEQILKWNPDVIILAGEADYSVEDVLKDTNLSECNAVKNGNVFKFPASAESLDSPVPAGVYGSMWLASVLHPEVVSEDEYMNAISGFYKTFYGFEYQEN